MKIENLHILYPYNGEFTLSISENLIDKCNAPNNYGGIYLIFNKKQLLYIGISGRKLNNELIVRKSGLGGIKDRIVNGYHPKFGKIKRNKAFKNQMLIENIDKLTFKWFVTYDFKKYFDFPVDIEKKLIQNYISINNTKPNWHK